MFEGYCDSDYVRKNNKKSVAGYAIYLFGNLIAWKFKCQKSVVLLSLEAEYIYINFRHNKRYLFVKQKLEIWGKRSNI